MKGLKISELKAFLHTLTDNDDAVITKEFMSELFMAFGDEYDVNCNRSVRTDENMFKRLVLGKAKGGESK